MPGSKLSLIFPASFILFISACAAIQEVDVDVSCEGGSGGVDSCDLTVTAKTKTVGGGFDSSKLVVDTSQSTTTISASGMTATISVRRNGVLVGTYDMQLERNGSSWQPVNSLAINSWFLATIQDYDDIEVGIGNMTVSPHQGTNLIVAELIYDGIVLAGASDSWYLGGGNDDNQSMF